MPMPLAMCPPIVTKSRQLGPLLKKREIALVQNSPDSLERIIQDRAYTLLLLIPFRSFLSTRTSSFVLPFASYGGLTFSFGWIKEQRKSRRLSAKMHRILPRHLQSQRMA